MALQNDPGVWTKVGALGDFFGALANFAAVYFAWLTVKNAVAGRALEEQGRLLLKKEAYFARYVMEPANEVVRSFENAAVDELLIYLGLLNDDPAQTEERISTAVTAFQKRLAALRERFRFFEQSFGPGDGTLWPQVATRVNALEDDVAGALEECLDQKPATGAIEQLVRDRAAAVLQELYRYDVQAHRVRSLKPTFLPSWRQ